LLTKTGLSCCLFVSLAIAFPQPLTADCMGLSEYIAVVQFTSCELATLPPEQCESDWGGAEDCAKGFAGSLAARPGVVVTARILSYMNILADIPPPGASDRRSNAIFGPWHEGGFSDKYFLRGAQLSCPDVLASKPKAYYSQEPCCDVNPPKIPECWLALWRLEEIPKEVQQALKKAKADEARAGQHAH